MWYAAGLFHVTSSGRYTHTDTHTHTHTHTHSLSLSLSLTLTHSHTHTHTLSLSLTHTHTHKHTHTHALSSTSRPRAGLYVPPVDRRCCCTPRPSTCFLSVYLPPRPSTCFLTTCPTARPLYTSRRLGDRGRRPDQWFREGLVFKARRLLYHSSLGRE